MNLSVMARRLENDTRMKYFITMRLLGTQCVQITDLTAGPPPQSLT